MIVDILFDPFINLGFMRRAIVACCALSMSITPVGVFLMLKRMSLIGDALSHAILPGIAMGYFYSGLSCIMMNIGGFISGLGVVMLSVWITEKTSLQKDASFTGFYLGSLSSGIVLMSLNKSDTDLLNLLFGSVLSITINNLKYIGVITTVTLIFLALFYRALIIEAFDPDFLKSHGVIVLSRYLQIFFLSIVVLNLIASLQITGTLMSIGLMMLPGLSARCWSNKIINILLLSVCIAFLCSWAGLLGAFYMSLPAGPTIVFCSSVFFFISILFGKNQGIFSFIYQKNLN